LPPVLGTVLRGTHTCSTLSGEAHFSPPPRGVGVALALALGDGVALGVGAALGLGDGVGLDVGVGVGAAADALTAGGITTFESFGGAVASG